MSIKQRHQTPIALSAALAATLVTSGCSSVSNALSGDKVDYRTSGNQTVKLEVPPDLSQLPGQQRYGQVAASSVSATSLMKGATPEAAPPSDIAPNQAGAVKLERQGQMRWLVVNQPPEQIWDQVRAFWTGMGFALTTDQPTVGVMETNWSENKANVADDGIIRSTLGKVFGSLYDTGLRDMYRTRIERTATGSEVYISHRGMSEEYTDSRKDQTIWRGRPSDPTLESEMLSRLMAKLGAPKDAVAAAKNDQAPATPTSNLARLNTDGLSLTVDADFDTSWRRVGLALDRSGFTVENRDRKQGVYEVRLSDNDPEASKPGFFARMFGASSNGDGLSRYKVQVQGQGKNSLVSVTDEKGQASNTPTARRIVKQLLDELG
ncbi:MAG: outer membrane protein assembly factor BamC [Aquabacterium sp.]